MPNGKKALATDPYAHQPDGVWKTERQQSDRHLLSQILEMTEEEVYEASKQFLGREIELFKFLFAMRFLSHTRFELTESATILKICLLIFAIEGISPENLKPSERLSRFLVSNVSREDKLRLIASFTFTPEYQFGDNREADRHLMFKAATEDSCFRTENFLDRVPEFCSTGPFPTCFCWEWLTRQTDELLNSFVGELGKKLYEMRCAVVHDGAPVVFGEALANKPADVVSWSVSLVDAYPRNQRGYVTYESGILVSDLSAIIMRGLRQCFKSGAKF